jgi:outer membrane protein assembly factor BamB
MSELTWDGLDARQWDRLRRFDLLKVLEFYPWFQSNDWWMYQHDVAHSGRASGWSDIRAANAGNLVEHRKVAVDGPIITKPAIVDGTVYVGSGKTGGGNGGTLYKIDLYTGTVEGRYPTSGHGHAFYTWYEGIGGSPAVVGNRVYFTGVHGKVYCLDTATMTPNPPHPPAVWITDLKNSNPTTPVKNQPIGAPNNADSWSGPLVVNGKVYVGSGEGEDEDTYGFVYCLDANTGDVLWLFCTSKFSSSSHNQPNTIPASVAASWATTAGYTVVPDSPETGSGVWSSCAYLHTTNRIYVGTGNSQYPGTDLPDEYYGSGLLALDADTGAFRGFFQPTPDDSYRPDDADIDVPGSATIYRRNDKYVVGFGSKNGSYFLLDPICLGGWLINAVITAQLAKTSVSMAVFGDKLHMVHLGDSSNRIWHSTFDGEGWSENVVIEGQLSKASPALAAFTDYWGDGGLHMLHLGDKSNRIWHSTFDGRKWSQNQPIANQLSKAPPALAAFEEALHLVHLGDVTNRLWFTCFAAWPVKRQLLPRQSGSGTPGDRGNAISTVAPGGSFENQWGIYATAAVHSGSGRLFVGLGGRGAITDLNKTPFMRALDWHTLLDAWPTDPNDGPGEDGVSRYTTASPPMYTTSEVGLSSPAVVNDVVFMGTNRSALYAFDVNTGLKVWSAESVSSLPAGAFALGPAIYGRYVVMGAGQNVFIYRVPYPVFELPERYRLMVIPELILPGPPIFVPKPIQGFYE